MGQHMDPSVIRERIWLAQTQLTDIRDRMSAVQAALQGARQRIAEARERELALQLALQRLQEASVLTDLRDLDEREYVTEGQVEHSSSSWA